MDWFRVDSDLMRHPRVIRLAQKVEKTVVAAVGHLVSLWSCIAEHAEDGLIKSVEDPILEKWAEWDGRGGVFATALREVEMVDATTGELRGWKKRHAKMLRERMRNRKYRSVKKQEKAQRARSERVASGAPRAGVTRVPYRTVPDHTEEKEQTPFSEDVLRLHAIYCEATERDPERFQLDSKKAARYSELIAWAGSFQNAETGIRKVASSPYHRGHNDLKKHYDRLLKDKPFRSAEDFQGWCEPPSGPPPVPGNGSRPSRDAEHKAMVERVFSEPPNFPPMEPV